MEKNLMYQEVLKQVKEGVYFVDTNRKISFWNKHAEKIFICFGENSGWTRKSRRLQRRPCD